MQKILNAFSKWLTVIYSHIKSNTTNAERQIWTYGILMTINFPLYLIIWHYESPQSYGNPILRLVATALCAVLIGIHHWPTFLKKFLPLYWYFVITFTLPFFFVFMTLKNHGDTLWLMNLMSAFFFVFLLLDFISAVLVVLFGSVFAWLAFIMVSSEPLIFNPFFFSDADFKVRPASWQSYLHPVKLLKSIENYYCAYIHSTSQYQLEQNTVSYAEYLSNH